MVISVQHDQAGHRFYAEVEGYEPEMEYEHKGDGVLDYTHTRVPGVLRGRGIAGAIVRRALDYAKDEGLRVIATCPYVQDFIENNPEYKMLTGIEN